MLDNENEKCMEDQLKHKKRKMEIGKNMRRVKHPGCHMAEINFAQECLSMKF